MRQFGLTLIAFVLPFSCAAMAQEMQPGTYETSVTIEMLNGPPGSFQDKDCVTAKEIAEGLTKIGIESDAECKVENLVKGGGKISYRLLCQEDGQKQIAAVSGTYRSDAFEFAVKPETRNTRFKSLRIKGRRVGICK